MPNKFFGLSFDTLLLGVGNVDYTTLEEVMAKILLIRTLMVAIRNAH